MKWTSVKDKLPESGERVLVYWYESPDLHQTHICEYFREGEIVRDEVRYTGTPMERLLDAMFGKRGEKTIEQDGFYIYDSVDDTGLCKWRRHADIITHWMALPEPPEDEQ